MFLISCPSSEPKKAEPTQTAPTQAVRNKAENIPFDVRKDGFGFNNYGNLNGVQNLGPEHVEQLCGRGTCARGTGNTCALSGAMRVFMDAQNNAMAGGHCDGMAVVAQAIYERKIPLSDYDSKARSTFALNFGNRTLQADIAKYFATQTMDPARSAEMRLAPSQVLSTLKQQKDSYTIGLYNIDGSNGHSVTAVNVIDDDSRWSRIKIYDNNYAGQWKYIRVDKSSNTWTYEDYDTGDSRSKTMTLIPLSSRFVAPKNCPAVGDDDAQYVDDDGENDKDQYADDDRYEDDDYYRNKHHQKLHEPKDNDTSPWNMWIDGPGQLVVDPNTKQFPRRSDSFSRQKLTPIYLFEPHQTNKIKLIAKDLKEKAKTNIVIFRSGQSLAIEGITLSDNQSDDVTLGQDGSSLTYRTKEDEAATIRLGQTYKGADYEIKIQPNAKQGGYELKIRNIVDAKQGNHELELQLKNSNGSRATYSIEMTRIAEKDDSFLNKDTKILSIEPKETSHIEYGKWIKNKQPLLILIDKDSDGKIDRTKQITDQD